MLRLGVRPRSANGKLRCAVRDRKDRILITPVILQPSRRLRLARMGLRIKLARRAYATCVALYRGQ